MRVPISLISACAALLPACSSIFDYRVGPASNKLDAAISSDWQPVSDPRAGIWRRDAAAADGGARSDASTGGGSRGDSNQPAKPSDADEDAGVSGRGSNEGEAPDAPPRSAAFTQAGFAALADWSNLPSFGDSSARVLSTHERDDTQPIPLIDPGNKDFNNVLAVCGDKPSLFSQQNDKSVECGPGEEGYLIAADDGPGYVSRILLARGISNPSSSVLVDLQPTDERIRVYIDGAETPSYEALWSDMASSLTAPFDAPFTGWTSGATVSYLPISYSKQLRVFVDDLTTSSFTLYYTQVSTQRVTETAAFDAAALTAPDARTVIEDLLRRPRNTGARWFDKQVTLDGSGTWMLWTRDRPGTLQRIELQLDAASAHAIMNETVLRLRWDEGPAPIDLPLALLFGARHTLAPLSTMPLSVEVEETSVRLMLDLPMPFAESASLELAHSAPSERAIQVRLYGTDSLPRGEWGHLHTAYAEQREPHAGARFQVAALSGRGTYLGTLMYMRGKADASRSVRASELGFLEGDERLEIDGQLVASGTGTDNYFNGGFYFKDGLFNTPFAAVSQLDVDTSEATSEATMVRWTILGEARHFQSQLDLSFELGADRPATVRDCAAVSFYYQ
jgi:hypothetical protein